MADAEGGSKAATLAARAEHKKRLQRDKGPCEELRTRALACSMQFPSSRDTVCKDHFKAYKECLKHGGPPPPEGRSASDGKA